MMRFLKFLEPIKQPPKGLHLVDIALFLAVIPHLSHLKFPVLVYLLFVVMVLLFKKEKYRVIRYGLGLFGLLSVVSSFYSDFNFSDFSKFTLYLSLLNVVLIYAVSLQRLKGEVNFYLGFSPAMLLMLSFFLHNSVVMLFYMVFVLFIFLLLFLWEKMQGSLEEVLKMALSIFAFSLPVVALLFLVFPRISFEKADYGFKDDQLKHTGHNGKMSLGSDALMVPSSQVVMELYFKKPLPKAMPLYFRGTTLYRDQDDLFLPLPRGMKRPLVEKRRARVEGKALSYDVTLYAHDERWLYTLDVPTEIPSKTTLFDDYTLESKKKVRKDYRYTLTSFPSYHMDAPISDLIKKAALQVDVNRDPISASVAKNIQGKTDEDRLNALKLYFRSLQLEYSLRPEPMDKKRPIDSFLLESKVGYCVHFAAAFTYMARVANLPTRVVTGYMLNGSDALDRYLVVREYSAHAWVEVYLEKKGWVRVETTDFAVGTRDLVAQTDDVKNRGAWGKFLHESNLRFMYTKYLVERWILEYSRVKQMDILDKLLHNSAYLVSFIFYAVLFVFGSISLALVFKRQVCSDVLLCALKPLLKSAQKQGIGKKREESMHTFLTHLALVYDENEIKKIDTLYHHIKYAKSHNEDEIKQFKKLVGTLKTGL